MKKVYSLFAAGVAAGATAGFLSPYWWTGFVAIAAGCIWAAYDLVDVKDADGDIAREAARNRQ